MITYKEAKTYLKEALEDCTGTIFFVDRGFPDKGILVEPNIIDSVGEPISILEPMSLILDMSATPGKGGSGFFIKVDKEEDIIPSLKQLVASLTKAVFGADHEGFVAERF